MAYSFMTLILVLGILLMTSAVHVLDFVYDVTEEEKLLNSVQFMLPRRKARKF